MMTPERFEEIKCMAASETLYPPLRKIGLELIAEVERLRVDVVRLEERLFIASPGAWDEIQKMLADEEAAEASPRQKFDGEREDWVDVASDDFSVGTRPVPSHEQTKRWNEINLIPTKFEDIVDMYGWKK